MADPNRRITHIPTIKETPELREERRSGTSKERLHLINSEEEQGVNDRGEGTSTIAQPAVENPADDDRRNKDNR